MPTRMLSDVIVVACLVGCGGDAKMVDQIIFVSNEQGIVDGDCSAVLMEVRQVAASQDRPTAAIREVLRDAHPSPSLHQPGTLPLIDYFRGVRIEDGSAIVSFDGPALEYLNNAACAQAAIKSPIERTLIQFLGVQRVEYEIDGSIFDEWDA